jgi:hypothetical protein
MKRCPYKGSQQRNKDLCGLNSVCEHAIHKASKKAFVTMLSGCGWGSLHTVWDPRGVNGVAAPSPTRSVGDHR